MIDVINLNIQFIFGEDFIKEQKPTTISSEIGRWGLPTNARMILNDWNISLGSEIRTP